MVYTTGVEAPVLIKAFQEKYPYIHVETGQGGSSDTTRKVIEEYNAGTYNVDTFETRYVWPPHSAAIRASCSLSFHRRKRVTARMRSRRTIIGQACGSPIQDFRL